LRDEEFAKNSEKYHLILKTRIFGYKINLTRFILCYVDCNMSGHPITKILNENRLEGPNFNEWLRNLKIVLTFDKIVYVLQDAPPHIPLAANATNAQRVAYQKHKDDDTQAKCVMLASMNPQLQKQHENMDSASAIILHLTELFGERNRNVRFTVVNDIVRTKQVRGACASTWPQNDRSY